MPTTINRETVKRMIADNAQLVDVRSRDAFDAEHLPEAVSLPIKTLDSETAAQLDRNRPVITYCWDSQ